MCHTRRICPSLLLILGLVMPFAACQDKAPVTVLCSRDMMTVLVPAAAVAGVKIDKWAGIPGCQFAHTDQHYIIHLALTEDMACGTTRVTNTVTGASLFYQRLRVYSTDSRQEHLMVKCASSPDTNATVHNIVRRDLPPEFVEPDYIEITSEVSGSAPVPVLGVGVRQDGALVDGAINVAPGTPLTMEVFLDDLSSGTYGILVSYLEVADNGSKKETMVYNGCTIDSTLFENFGTKSGDFLTAKFRAFKFPESNYVLFRGTVDVCLDRCQGITCSDGVTGYGRRRRSVPGRQADPNKVFEVTMTTYIKFSDDVTDKSIREQDETYLLERLAYSGVSADGREEVPLTRRSPDVPPSISFSSGTPYTPRVLLSVLALLLVRFL